VNRLLLIALVACSNNSPTATTAATPPAPVIAAKGHVTTRTFHSDALGVDKDYVVYLPAGYEAKPDMHWPVFYYLHGLTGDEHNWIKHGKLDEVADKLGLGAIVVMPDGDDGFYVDAVTPVDYDACMRDGTGLWMPAQSRQHTCVRQRNYETYIVKDLIADVDSHFHTIAKREGRAIAGFSMGGFGALELSMRHLDLFAAAASHSGIAAVLYAGPHPYDASKVVLVTDVVKMTQGLGSIGGWLHDLFGSDLAHWQAYDPAKLVDKLTPGALALYLDCGTEDGFGFDANASYLHDLLLAKKIDHEFFIGPGHHDFVFWTARLPHSLAFLRDHVAKPS
jgi:S-formylglutathione hydrolase FrmB